MKKIFSQLKFGKFNGLFEFSVDVKVLILFFHSCFNQSNMVISDLMSKSKLDYVKALEQRLNSHGNIN